MPYHSHSTLDQNFTWEKTELQYNETLRSRTFSTDAMAKGGPLKKGEGVLRHSVILGHHNALTICDLRCLFLVVTAVLLEAGRRWPYVCSL